MSVSQKHPWGCGVACVAFVAGISYDQALALFGRDEDSSPGYYCPDLKNALSKVSLSYTWAEFQPTNTLPDGTIVFIKPSSQYPGGHWLVKTQESWMNPWINFPITPIKSGFDQKLPGIITWFVAPLSVANKLFAL